MGCDGGSIPRRDEMVKLKKKAEKIDPEAELAAKWRHCALSGEKLKKPVVACELGRLYNKESLLLALLDKPSLPEVAQHIRSLRDIVELQLTPNPAYKPHATAMAEATKDAEFVCPISGLEMSGRHRFIYIRGCGCVISEKALKEAPSENCHKCGHKYLKEEVIVLNGSEEEVKALREAMAQRRMEAKQEKLAKRKRKNESSLDQSSASENKERISPPIEKRLKSSEEDNPSTSTPQASTLLTNGCLQTTKDKAKKMKGSLRQNAVSISKTSSAVGSKLRVGSSASSIVKKATEELTSSFKAPGADPNARDAYKALFNSADKERPKEKCAHWVTFFPYH